MRTPTGEPPGFAGRHLEFERLIADVSARLMAAASDVLDAAIETALEGIRLFFGADRAGLLAVSAEGTVTISHAAVADGLSLPPRTIDLAKSYPWSTRRLLVDREVVYIPSVAHLTADAAMDRTSFESLGTITSLTVPIVREDAVACLIVIHGIHAERTWWECYVPRLRFLGEMFVSALDRRRAFEELRASGRQLCRAATGGGCGLWNLNPTTGDIWATNVARRLYGFAPDQQVPWPEVLARLHPEDRDRLVRRVEDVMASGGAFDEQYRLIWPDGQVRWLHATGEATADHLEGATVDVTELVEAKQSAQEALEEVRRLRDRLEHENVYLRREVRRFGGVETIIGRSSAIRNAIALADRVAPTDATVLLLGETGVGKERFANYIHDASRRREHMMVRVNCSAIPVALVESELFGREKGAFTGAASRQLGRFELAHGSTLFLDEIGDLPAEVQVKLLRALEEGTIERLGSPRPIRVDVRIIAATHCDLRRAVAAGTFREDLYYRLNVFPLSVPPLRDRREDIPLLVEALIEDLVPTIGKRVSRVCPSSMAALIEHDWPGNVRELRNVIERAVILSSSAELCIDPALFEAAPRTTAQPATCAPGALDRDRILQVLRDAGWRIRGDHGAAARLGLKPTTLEARMRKLGITRPGIS